MDVSIYLCENAERKFMPSSILDGQDPVRTDYRLAWYGKVDAKDLEDVFYIFNHPGIYPKGYKARSLSIGDIVGNGEGLWYCDDIGWKPVKWKEETR